MHNTSINGHNLDQTILTAAGLFFGWLLALWFVPTTEFQEAGALIPSGVALSLGLAFGPTIAAIRNPDSFFRVEHILMFGLFYWVVFDAAQGAYGLPGVTREAIIDALSGITLMAAAIWIGSLLVSPLNRSLPVGPTLRLNPRFVLIAAIVCFLLGMLRVFLACRLSPVCMVSALYAPRFANAWSVADIGYFDTILVRLQYFAYLILPLTVALHHLERRFSWRVLVAGLLGLMFLSILISTGGRRQVGMVLGATALIWILLNRPISLRKLIIVAVFLALMLYLLQLMISWRNVGFAKAFNGEPEYAQAIETPGFIDIDKNLLFLTRITTLVPEQYPHTAMDGIIFIATAPVPRTVYPDKPVNRGFPMAYLLQLRVGPGWTWTASAVGDLYLIGGYLAIVFGGLLFGALASLCNRLLYPITVRRVALYGISAMTLFIGLRAIHDVVIASLAILALWGITETRNWITKSSNEQHELTG